MDAAQDAVTLPRVQYEQLMGLARRMRAIVNRGPEWITVVNDEDIRQFDPTEEALSLRRYLRHHPEARTTCVFEFSGEETHDIVGLCNVLKDLAGEELISPPPGVDPEPAQAWTLPHPESDRDPVNDRLLKDAHQAQLNDAADDSALICSECGHADVKRRTVIANVSLIHTQGSRPEQVQAQMDQIACAHCDHVEDLPNKFCTHRAAVGKLIANRLMISQPVDGRDLYMFLENLFDDLAYTGTLMTEMLVELVETIDQPDGPTVADDGTYTGHFVLDSSSVWECDIFDQLEALGAIHCVGGVLYQQMPVREQIANPFAAPLLDDKALTGSVH